MNNFSTELKVGIFAIIVIFFLSYMTFKVGSLPLIWEKGYRLYVEFDDISGLDEQSRIKVAGVEAGVVEKIRLEDGKAKLTLLMNPDVKVYRNAKAYLRMSGLLGDKYLALSTGTSDKPVLEYGDTITNTVPSVDIGELANKLSSAAVYISDLTKNINSIFGETQREEIRESINNLKVVTGNLREISTVNKEPLQRVIAQLEDFTEALSDKGPGLMDDIRKVAKKLGDKGPELIDNLNNAASGLNEVIVENRYAFKESMENIRTASASASTIARKLERGEGTLGKLLKDGELYDSLTKVSIEASKSLDVVGRLRTFMDFHSEYNTGESKWKGYFDLTLQPRRDKYYILGVVSDPKGSVDTIETIINGSKTTEERIESKLEFTAQFAKRFDDLALRIGLMENTFGFGSDYFFNNDSGRIKLDIWDLNDKEVEADRAHARIGVDYRIFKFIFVSGGIDNLLNSNRRGVYVGAGIKFEDEDFKYIFGKSASISLQ
ncbi:MAG TPA: MCE family protein [Nitrospirae bacterium]|nr:putative phospholipid ABC transporter-binding protein MlaD [bacterium BMS3Abin06]HDH12342.1 MCE family protein [Nitrospirota bacterium]HDZ00367.1 MCE family protein [Nitrospirota bacterium]